MDTLSLTCEIYNFSFLNVKLDMVFTTPLLYRISLGDLQFSTDFISRYIFKSSAYKRISEYLSLAQRSLIKTLNKRSQRVEPCGTTDNTEYTENTENFPKMRSKEDLDQ
jgi:hypothetical protein